MDKAELVMRRRNVLAFIKADPIQLIVVRAGERIKNEDTGGYIKPADVSLPPQMARIVQNVRRFTAGINNAEAGDIPNSEYRLLGMHTLDLQPNDKFQWLNEWYRVLPDGIHKARIESTLAAISLLGGTNRA